jgi:hypothetical protein
VEFGSCGDLNHTEKVAEKAQHHAQLAARLQEAGWNVCDGPHTIITLGYPGSIQRKTNDLLRTLGCKDGQAGMCMSRLHSLATKYAAAILPKRRWLENNMPMGIPRLLAGTALAVAGLTAKGEGIGFVLSPSVALACKGPLHARLATGAGLSFFLFGRAGGRVRQGRGVTQPPAARPACMSTGHCVCAVVWKKEKKKELRPSPGVS